jgi:hypothetical protein
MSKLNLLRMAVTSIVATSGLMLTISQEAQSSTCVSNAPETCFTGVDRQVFDSYLAITSGFEIDLELLGIGTGVANTTEQVGFTLDDTQESIAEVNYDTGIVTFTWHLVPLPGYIPYLEPYGIASVAVNATATATIENVTKTSDSFSNSFPWSNVFEGTYTQPGAAEQNFIGEGQGESTSSFPYPFGININTSTSTLAPDSAVSAITIDGDTLDLGETGNGIEPVPEPSSILTLPLLTALGAAFKRKGKLKSSRDA